MTSFILNNLSNIHWWNLADAAVAILFVTLFVWGRSNKLLKKNEFNEDFLSLDTMKSLRGFAALGVILHHISQQQTFQQEGILLPFVNAGAYFVAIFFFCSGYGLLKSYDAKPDYLKGFIKKRIVKSIVLPFYVDVLVYAALYALFKIHLEKEQWITNIAGITMMNQYAWFPIVLAILYLVFFLTFRFVRNRKACFAIIFAFIILMGVGCMIEGHYAWWTGPSNWWCSEYYWTNEAKWWMGEKIFWFHGEWWVNSAPAFLTGLIFANYEKKIVKFFKENYWKRFFILVIITEACFALSDFGQAKFGYWTEFNRKGPEIGNKIATYFCQVPLFLIIAVTVFIFLMKYHVSNPISRFFGKYSLHTYLMNLAALTVMNFMQYNQEWSPFYLGGKYNNLFVDAILVILLTVGGGVLEQKLTDKIRSWIFREKVAVAPASFTRASLLEDEDDVYSRKKAMFRHEGEGAGEKEEAEAKVEAKDEAKAEEAKAEVKKEAEVEPKKDEPKADAEVKAEAKAESKKEAPKTGKPKGKKKGKK